VNSKLFSHTLFRQDKELFRLSSSKFEAEIQTEKLKSEKLRREMDLIIMRARKIKDGPGNGIDMHDSLIYDDEKQDDDLNDREPIDLATTNNSK